MEMVPLTTQKKIEETVKGILREADMDLMTEFKLRISASSILGFDLSGPNHKKLVRDVLEAFLLSNPPDDDETVAPVDPNPPPTATASAGGGEDERFICKVCGFRTLELTLFIDV